uniref:Reverse transcriptase domain-containing protein n=1 Tax=Strongyloides venezuelensis TaxID=75913 RepID=A0A0K0FWJ7_STRVS
PCSSSIPLSSKAIVSGNKKNYIEKVKPLSISGDDLTLSDNITVATIPIVENGLSTISSTKIASSSLVKEISCQNYEVVQSQVAFLNTVITVSEHKQTRFSCYTVEGKLGKRNSVFQKTTSYFKKFKSYETLSYIISKTINRLFSTLLKSFFQKINIVTNSNTIQEMIMDLNNKPGSFYSIAKSKEFYVHTKNIINEGKIEEVNVIT